MNIAYADPPYLGCCALYGHEHGISGECWDAIGTHARLINDLSHCYPDGWALSLSSPSLEEMLHLCRDILGPNEVRVSPWVKPFAVFKPNVNPAYAWEPVIWRGGRQKRSREEPTVRDWVSAEITLRKGLTGAKPETFVRWLFAVMGLQEHDTVTDLYPGTGVVGRTWDQYRRQQQLFGSENRCAEQMTLDAATEWANGTD